MQTVAQAPILNVAKNVMSSGLQLNVPGTVTSAVVNAQKVGTGLSGLVLVPPTATGGGGTPNPPEVPTQIVSIITSPPVLIGVPVVAGGLYLSWKYWEYKENKIIPTLLKAYDKNGTCLENNDRETFEKILAASKITLSKEQRRLIEAQYGFFGIKNGFDVLKKSDFDSRRFIISLDTHAQQGRLDYLTQKYGPDAKGFKPTFLKDTLHEKQPISDVLEQRGSKNTTLTAVKSPSISIGDTKNDESKRSCWCGCGFRGPIGECSCTCTCNCSKKDWASNKDGYTYEHGIYAGANYHHINSTGNSKGGKGPAPKDGQRALDNSFEIGDDGKRRVSIDIDGNFAIFDRTSKGACLYSKDVFHGHIRTWEELTDEMRQIFRKNNLASKKGKII